MAEKAQDRQEMRLDKAMDYEYGDRRLGLFLGFFALLSLLTAGVIIIALGNVVVGTGLLGAAIIGTVIGTFVHGRRSEPQEASDETDDDDEEDEEPSKDRPSFWRRLIYAFTGR